MLENHRPENLRSQAREEEASSSVPGASALGNTTEKYEKYEGHLLQAPQLSLSPSLSETSAGRRMRVGLPG
jgi:hypothetical protein